MIHYITTEGIANAWVGNELRIVEQAGIPFRLHAMRPAPQTCFEAEWAERINQATRVLYPLPLLGMLVSVVVAPFLFRRRLLTSLWNALTGERESTRARLAALAHLFVAAHWARALRSDDVRLVHAQWAHSCGTIGMYGAWLLNVPFSFTGHATDLFRDRVALRDKVRRADTIVCISTFHRDFYRKLGARDDQLVLAYCGVDVDGLVPKPREDTAKKTPFRIIASGRLVEKKGFFDLIEGCRILADDGLAFECEIAGDGPLYEPLREAIQRSGLAGRIRLTGRFLKQERLAEFMHPGDVFCLPCVQAADGDIDGLPQMLMEAMACGIPVISTRLVGIPDLVIDGETGVLVDPGRPDQLAHAVRLIHDDRDHARSLSAAGRRWVCERFDIQRSLAPLLERFRSRLNGSARSLERAAESPPALGAQAGP